MARVAAREHWTQKIERNIISGAGARVPHRAQPWKGRARCQGCKQGPLPPQRRCYLVLVYCGWYHSSASIDHPCSIQRSTWLSHIDDCRIWLSGWLSSQGVGWTGAVVSLIRNLILTELLFMMASLLPIICCEEGWASGRPPFYRKCPEVINRIGPRVRR